MFIPMNRDRSDVRKAAEEKKRMTAQRISGINFDRQEVPPIPVKEDPKEGDETTTE